MKNFDYKLLPLKGEVSARKSILPFKYTKVKKGDYVLGRPTGQGCPVQHVLEVIEQEKSGVITGWVVGPKYSRNKKVVDIGDYWVIRFEGMAEGKPIWGKRQRFLPGYCMMDIVHTGIVNFISDNIVKIEGIIIL
jgi:hypothetical protein